MANHGSGYDEIEVDLENNYEAPAFAPPMEGYENVQEDHDVSETVLEMPIEPNSCSPYNSTGVPELGGEESWGVDMDDKPLDENAASDAEDSNKIAEAQAEAVAPPLALQQKEKENAKGPEIREDLLDQNTLTEQEARDCLDEFIAKNTWLKERGIGKSLKIREITASNSFVVLLETSVEGRKLVNQHRPFIPGRGEIDDNRFGPSPGPWQIAVEMPPPFVDKDITHLLPHSEKLDMCFACRGNGEVTCRWCNGGGQRRCSHCNGSGWRSHTHYNAQTNRHESRQERCLRCHAGYERCHTCNGTGRIRCKTCDGYRQLVHYTAVKIKFQNRVNKKVVKASASTESLPFARVSEAEGPLVFAEEDVLLKPRDQHSTQRVNSGVNKLVNSMITSAADTNVLQHRQRLRVNGIPTYHVSYTYNGKDGEFWVAGTNRETYAPVLPWSILRIGFLIAGILVLIALISAPIVALVLSSQSSSSPTAPAMLWQ